MQVIKYNLIHRVNTGTETDPVWIEVMGADVTVPFSVENVEIAKAEAWQGEVSDPYDDGTPEPEPSDADRLAALEEALGLILSGVTE